MTPELLTIGDFARAVGLSASALRHYDECGLLVPARTDESTGYRYYTPDLERRARLVAMMREVGVPIEAMRAVLDGTPDEAHDLLVELTHDREQRASRTRDVIETVRATLDLAGAAGLVRLRVDGPALAAAVRQVRAAADRDPTSPLAAVLLDVQGDQVDVVATNRYWMACRTIPGSVEVSGDARAALPLPDAGVVAERLDHCGEVTLVLTADGLAVEDDDDLSRHATSPRPYPAHRLVLAALEPPATTVLVERDRLVESVAAAGRSVVAIGLADDLVEVSGGGAVPAVVRGKPQSLSCRSALLLRAAGSCLGARVRLELTDPTRPVRLSSPEQPGFVALAMPTLEA